MKDDFEDKHIKQPVNREGWPPQCWLWSFDNIERIWTDHGGDWLHTQWIGSKEMIEYHDRNKKYCPYCIEVQENKIRRSW